MKSDNEGLAQSLAESNVFALLVVKTTEETIVTRPIGGKYGSSIQEAIKEAVEKYPGCQIRMYEQNYDAFHGNFGGIVEWESLF